MNKKKGYCRFYIFLSYLIITGSLYAQAVTNKDAKSILKEREIIFTNFFKFDKGPVRMFLQNQSSIILWNSNGIVDYFFYQYSLDGTQLTGKFVKGGRRFAQGLGVASAGLYKNRTLWLHDGTLNKVMTIDLPKTAADTAVIREYSIPKLYYTVQLFKGSRILAAGAVTNPGSKRDSSKIQELDLRSTEEVGKYGSFTDVPKNIPYDAWKIGHQGFLFLKPTEDKVIMTYRYSDKSEIFDLTTRKSKLVSGPKNFEAEFTPIKVQGMDLVTRNDKTRFAFIGGAVTNRYIYLLYSGKSEIEAKANNYDGNCIYVYDWNGNTVVKLNLDRYISGFGVSAKDDTMYAYDRKSGYVMKTKLKF